MPQRALTEPWRAKPQSWGSVLGVNCFYSCSGRASHRAFFFFMPRSKAHTTHTAALRCPQLPHMPARCTRSGAAAGQWRGYRQRSREAAAMQQQSQQSSKKRAAKKRTHRYAQEADFRQYQRPGIVNRACRRGHNKKKGSYVCGKCLWGWHCQ